MKKEIKILLFILSILIFSSSCAKHSATDPRLDNTDNNAFKGVAIGNGYDGTVYYGNKSFTGRITQEKIEELWKSMVSDKTVYNNSSYQFVTGNFKSDAHYYESTWNSGTAPRTEFRKCLVQHYNGKDYIAGIYWDNKTGVGMQIRYRLIIIDEDGAEQAWYGGGSSENAIPNENTTDWVKYWFVFGYIKL